MLGGFLGQEIKRLVEQLRTCERVDLHESGVILSGRPPLAPRRRRLQLEKGERAPRGSIALALPQDDREAALAVDARALGAFAFRARVLSSG